MNIRLNSSTDMTGTYSTLQGGSSIVCGSVHNSRVVRHTNLSRMTYSQILNLHRLLGFGQVLRPGKFPFSYLQSEDDETYLTRVVGMKFNNTNKILAQ